MTEEQKRDLMTVLQSMNRRLNALEQVISIISGTGHGTVSFPEPSSWKKSLEENLEIYNYCRETLEISLWESEKRNVS